MIVNSQKSKYKMMKSWKRSIKKIKKQSISKTKWGCQNPQEGSYGHDNQIEDKTEKKNVEF
jgi:hypothetical protein